MIELKNYDKNPAIKLFCKCNWNTLWRHWTFQSDIASVDWDLSIYLDIKIPREKYVYISADEVVGDPGEVNDKEYVRSSHINFMCFSPYCLKLETGAIIILLRKLYILKGMCK